MKADPKFVREHYRSLSDEELLATDRSDLVDMAQSIYDAEVSRRALAPRGRVPRADDPRSAPMPAKPPLVEKDLLAADGNPAWLADAVDVYSMVDGPGAESRIADARQILETAGIACHQEVIEIAPEECTPDPSTHRWRIMVPPNLSWRAMSTLDRDTSNPEFEAAWKAHLEALSDKDLPAMDPQFVFCGLYDRIDRAARVYEEEMARRGLEAADTLHPPL
jgi:hypothetical protein